MGIYNMLLESKQQRKKLFAVLVDPDKISASGLEKLVTISLDAGVDLFFVGGSLLTENAMDVCISSLKKATKIPVVLFPGNTMQLSYKADAILFLSLISGRNAEMLIGRHVVAAPYLKRSPLEVISTGYILIDSGRPTAVAYMSNSFPIPADKHDIAACTAMAGEMLGMKLIYLDAGSGAAQPVPPSLAKVVYDSVSVPVIIGGGICTPEKARELCLAGADIIVVGNAIEKNTGLIPQLADSIHHAV